MTADPDVAKPATSYKTAQLSEEQEQAFSAICDFIENSDKKVFTLHGLAGTGKTTLLAEVARTYQEALLCTLTGKAASVLFRKTGIPAQTIHSAMYRLEEEKFLPSGKQDLHFVRVRDDGSMHGGIILLDECSMVTDEHASDMLATGAKLVACGDPGQLPPVKGNPFFINPTVTLKTIHRQAMDSPIIRQAYNVREHGRYVTDGSEFVVKQRITGDEILGADAILCWKNSTRAQLNQLKRAWLGIARKTPQRGETVVCLMNNREVGLFNGATYELGEDYEPYSNRIVIRHGGQDIEIEGTFFEDVDSAGRRFSRGITPFAYGYAMTVHKAQGSEWTRIILVDEYASTDDYQKWAYTGITRAAQYITVQRAW